MTHRLRCFGRLAIEDEGGERVQLRSRKHLALLVYLAAHPDRRHERGRLAGLFWDTEPDLARHSLSQALYDLGKHLPDLDLDRTNREVGLGRTGFAYEGRAFEEAVREDRLDEAVRLYEGPFAPDLETVGGPDFERWVERERTRFRSLAEKALLRQVSACADAGRWGEMVMAGNRLVDMNPLSEEAHRAVMKGLWLRGDRSAALAHFQEHEDFLEKELPGGVSAETRELIEKIRSADRAGGGRTVRERPRPEMVGREEEFRVLKDALADVMEGESRFIVIRGEAGIGKTRLLEEFAEVAALEDVRLLKSRCYAAESDVPYGPIVDGLRELAQEFAESPEAEDTKFYQLGHLFPEVFGKPEAEDWLGTGADAAKRRLANELKDFLTWSSDNEPIVWLIEDLHWTDSTSRWVLNYISRRINDQPVLVAVTSRKLGEGLKDGQLAIDYSLELTLEPLSDQEVERLLLSGGSNSNIDTKKVISLADGNPFYALELSKSQVKGEVEPDFSEPFESNLPEPISRALSAKFATTTEQENRILGIVAVADAYAYPGLIINLTELSSKKLIEVARLLRRRSILRMEKGRLAYRHDIVRRFFYHSLDSLSRTAIHVEVASWLEDNDDQIDEGTLARHYYNARKYEKAYHLAFDAATKAIQRYANREAINLGELALECARSDHAKSEARSILGEAHYRSGNVTEALSYLTPIEDSGTRNTVIGDRSIHLLRADAAVEVNDWAALDEAVKALETTGEPTKRDYLWAKHLVVKAAIRRNDEGLSEKTLNEVVGVEVTPDEVESETLIRMTQAAHHAFYGDIGDSRGYIDFVQENATRLPRTLQYTARLLAVVVAHRLGELDIARSEAETTYHLATRYHDMVPALTSLNNMSATCLELGEWETAKETLQKIESILQSEKDAPDNVALMVASNKADYLFYTEQSSLLDEYGDRLLAAVSSQTAGYIQPELMAVYGLNAAAMGNIKEARSVWETVRREHLAGSEIRSGVQNTYKFYWLHAALSWLNGNDDSVTQLRNWARVEDRFDELAAVKLRWLAWLFENMGSKQNVASSNGLDFKQSEEFANLSSYNVSWFGYFSRRWLNRVRALNT